MNSNCNISLDTYILSTPEILWAHIIHLDLCHLVHCVCVGTVLKIVNYSFQMVVDQVITSTHVYHVFHHLNPQKHTAFQILTQLIPDAAFENATLMLHILSRPQLSSTMITISMKMMTGYLRIVSFLSDIHWLTNYPMHFYWSETCEPDSGDYTFSKVDMHGNLYRPQFYRQLCVAATGCELSALGYLTP